MPKKPSNTEVELFREALKQIKLKRERSGDCGWAIYQKDEGVWSMVGRFENRRLAWEIRVMIAQTAAKMMTRDLIEGYKNKMGDGSQN